MNKWKFCGSFQSAVKVASKPFADFLLYVDFFHLTQFMIVHLMEKVPWKKFCKFA